MHYRHFLILKIICVCIVLLPGLGYSQRHAVAPIPDVLDFERPGDWGVPYGWSPFEEGSHLSFINLDGNTVYSGKYSLCITGSITTRNGLGCSVPIADVRGKHLRISGYVKTENALLGHAQLWCQVSGENGSALKYITTDSEQIAGTEDWQYYSLSLNIDTTATDVFFGVFLKGLGRAWFDHLTIEIDSVLYTKELPANPFINSSYYSKYQPHTLTAEQLQWLQDNIDPCATSDADTSIDDDPDSAFRDLMPLKQLVGNAHIVGLGEATHGTHEFFTMKQRLVEFLVREMGFTVFAIEEGLPDVEKINKYILCDTCTYNTAAIVDSLFHERYIAWRTQEMVDLIRWMHNYNKSHRDKLIQFMGIDVTAKYRLESLLTILNEIDAVYSDSIKNAVLDPATWLRYCYHIRPKIYRFNYINPNDSSLLLMDSASTIVANSVYQAAYSIFEHFKNEPVIPEKLSIKADWIMRECELICNELYPALHGVVPLKRQIRDSVMAANIFMLRKDLPSGTKIIVWAHNGHIGRIKWKMGEYLSRRYGSDYVPIAFCFGGGDYNIFESNIFKPVSSLPAMPGSYEWLFHLVKVPLFFLNFQKISSQNPLSLWLATPKLFHDLGVTAPDEEFSTVNLVEEYDGVFYFDKTTPSIFLK